MIRAEPDWSKLPAGTPLGIRRLLARCLQKERGRRLRDIADARFQIEEALNEPAGAAPAAAPSRTNRERIVWIAAALMLFFIALFLATRPPPNVAPADRIGFPVFPPEGTSFSFSTATTVSVPQFALSPDGRALVFGAQVPGGPATLWLRPMEQVSARQLPGTEDAQHPFWSPDGRWIGFFAAGKLKRIPAEGGPVQVAMETVDDFRGATWGARDIILAASGTEPILQVHSTGGQTAPVTTVDGSRKEATHRAPQFLPDGLHFLYSILGGAQHGVYVGSIEDKTTKKLLVPLDTSAIFASPGYLLFVNDGTLMGQSLDAERLELTGQPFIVADHVGRDTAFMSAVSASRTGTIAYAGVVSQNGRLTWVDRDGNPAGAATGIPEGDYVDFRLSPDDKTLAASLADSKTGGVTIWLTDLASGRTQLFASGGAVTASAVWSPDGSRLAYRSNRNGVVEFFLKSAAGGGSDQPLFLVEAYRTAQVRSFNIVPTDWSPDGRYIVFYVPDPVSGNDLWRLPIAGDRKPVRFIASPKDQMHGALSPDGHLVAYTSNESGKYEVYVETFPERSDRKVVVSANGGGYEPRWRADGREIYYLSGDRKLMAISVGPDASFGIPKPLFQTRVLAGVTPNRIHYAPSRDGQRFLLNTQIGDASPNPITVLSNWTAGLKK